MSKAKKCFWIGLGLISMVVGCIGIVLPLLPTTPFLILASFSFAKGSERFHNWFTSTKIYKNHLESFEKDKAMTLKTKLSILLPVSVMLIVAFIMMKNIYGRGFIVFLILFKYYYFIFNIRTIKNHTEDSNKTI